MGRAKQMASQGVSDSVDGNDKMSIHIEPGATLGPGRGGRVPRMADLRDLAARVKFAPQDGRIWLDETRMILMHSADLGALHRELIGALGHDEARQLLTRIGYSAGARDAALAIELRGSRTLGDTFAVGPQLHALEGFVAVEPIRIEVDVERGIHYVEQYWHDSAEAGAHLEACGMTHTPACWMQTGYASGFNSALFGRPILFKELHCRAMGEPCCRIVGKPVEAWEEVEEDLRFLRTEEFVNATLTRSGRRLQVSTPATAPHASQGVNATEGMVGASPGFFAACQRLKQVAPTNASVLLLGETGVGKERFARMLHQISRRANGPFVALNCAAIPENLLEAELFGVERGAYTGAHETRKGRFERADQGTLFLDEIGTLNEGAQAKLLRALQEREIERVGGSGSRRVDVRVVAATNLPLAREAREGRFRMDLFYRLNVFPIEIPPLRERRDDIALLVHHFVAHYSKLHGKEVIGFTHRAIAGLLSHDFPGNVRELENIIERAIILAPDGLPIDYQHLFENAPQESESVWAVDFLGDILPADTSMPALDAGDDIVDSLVNRALDASVSLEALELAAMKEAVRRSGGNFSMAARQLGISRAQLAYRLEKQS